MRRSFQVPRQRSALVWVLLVSAFLLPAATWAREPIRVTVDRSELTLDDQLLLTITIEGSRSARPSLPELPDFEVYSRGQSTQMSFVNGRASTSVAYSYVLVPKRIGVFEIGSATVELDGEVHYSKSITIKVLEAAASPQDSRDLFLSSKVSTTTAFVGQQITYTWRFYRRVQIANARLEPLQFKGFMMEELGEVREFQTIVNGVEYLVSEIRRALFPQEEGRLTIPASRLTCDVVVRKQRRRRGVFDDLFGQSATQAKVLRTRPVEIEVLPLPAPPADFSGLVGEFELEAELSKRELKVGESATLRLTISGEGNVQMISEPSLPDLPDFKVYDDKPDSSIDRSGGTLTGRRSYRKALVPLKAGDLMVPSIGLTFFDPSSAVYRAIRTPEIPLLVQPSDGEEELRLTESIAPGMGKVAVRILADDILPLYRRLDAVASRSVGWRRQVLLLAGLLVPPLAFLGVAAAQRRQQRFQLDSGLRRRHQALRRARKCVRKIRKQAIQGNAIATGQLVSKCLREYIGDKLGAEGCALTPEEAGRLLSERGVEDQLVEESLVLLDHLEAAQYGAEDLDAEELAARIGPLLRRLDRQTRS